MGRLAAIFGGLLGILLVPLALAGPTALVLLPAHVVFTGLAVAACVGEGVAGRPARVRLWLLGYLVASVAMVAALELGSTVRDGWYWVVPWAAALTWGWTVPAVALAFEVVGRLRERRLSSRAVRRRKRARARPRIR